MDDATKNLPNVYHQGYCYFDVNTGKFWIDTTDLEAGRKSINGTYYGVCDTAANVKIKTVSIPGFSLTTGITIHVKFTYNNDASAPTLSINGGTAIPIVRYGNTAIGTQDETTGWYAGAIVTLTYDGTNWVRDQGFNSNDRYYYTAVYSTTGANVAAKVGAGEFFTTTGSKYIPVVIQNSNTVASALTLDINGTGAKNIYINGSPSSSTNYTLPKGYYLVFYDSVNEIYHFRTDSQMAGTASPSTTTTLNYWNSISA